LAWVENSGPADSKPRVDQDAIEGFCELVAYLYVTAQHDEAQMGVIRSNAYTRGQFALFLEAEHSFGFNEIVEWLKYGVDLRLTGADLGRVRKVEVSGPTDGETQKRRIGETAQSPIRPFADSAVARVAPPAPAPETLALKGIL